MQAHALPLLQLRYEPLFITRNGIYHVLKQSGSYVTQKAGWLAVRWMCSCEEHLPLECVRFV
jgi:hypothetical protein